MFIHSLRLRDLRSFADSGELRLGRMTILVGRNNDGKSTVLRGLQAFQSGPAWSSGDVRVGAPRAELEITLEGELPSHVWPEDIPRGADRQYRLRARLPRQVQQPQIHVTWTDDTGNVAERSIGPYNASEPENLFYTYLSLRRVREYSANISRQAAQQISVDLTNLYAKIARLSPAHPQHERYKKACQDVLNFIVAPFPADPSGQKAGIYAGGDEYIAVGDMGAGVASALGLIVDLMVARDRVFLIEEPENDLHPRALKSLLDLVLESSESNQFIVSTPSHVVLRHLGAHPEAVVLRVTADRDDVPWRSECTPLVDEASRAAVLRDLGYEPHDFGMADGWILFEESSAERLVRDFLIPWFTPRLATFVTVAANGVDDVAPRLHDLHRLFLYLHRQSAYALRAWIVVDGDDSGRDMIKKLASRFSDRWPSSHFKHWSVDDFERFYPTEFSARVNEVLALPHGQQKQQAKRELLHSVLDWVVADPERAREGFERSAAEVIEFLREIEASVLDVPRSGAERASALPSG